jgi:methyl-accepting chemotaxis protein
MSSSKSILKVAIMLYLCVFLTGAPFVISSIAKITMKKVDKELKVITIVKGDTLWDLAEKWLKDPFKWKEFQKYNDYTNPDLIYPGEKMQIPIEVAEKIKEDIEKRVEKIEAELPKVSSELSEAGQRIAAELNKLKAAIGELEEKISTINLRRINRAIARLEESNEAIRQDIQALKDAVEELSKKSVGPDSINQVRSDIEKISASLDTLEEAVKGMTTQTSENTESVKTVTTQISQNRESLSKLEKQVATIENEMAGKTEEPNKNKRMVAILTALAGSVAWFVVSSMSRAD